MPYLEFRMFVNRLTLKCLCTFFFIIILEKNDNTSKNVQIEALSPVVSDFLIPLYPLGQFELSHALGLN